jgi:ribosome-associated protein
VVREFETAELAPWIEVRFDPSSGPGGQHVNKASTRATLLFDFETCDRLSDADRARLRRRLENRLSRDGRIRLVAQEGRSQAANRAAAEQRLCRVLSEALHVPRQRRATRPTAGSQRRRIKAKKERGELKRLRQRPPRRDE